jgi:hypothetical protein
MAKTLDRRSHSDEAAESVRLRRLLLDLRFPVDVIVVSRRYAEEWRGGNGASIHAAFSSGKRLRSPWRTPP